jgi:hypothetical protein
VRRVSASDSGSASSSAGSASTPDVSFASHPFKGRVRLPRCGAVALEPVAVRRRVTDISGLIDEGLAAQRAGSNALRRSPPPCTSPWPEGDVVNAGPVRA